MKKLVLLAILGFGINHASKAQIKYIDAGGMSIGEAGSNNNRWYLFNIHKLNSQAVNSFNINYGGSNNMTFLPTGQIGIGTDNPTAKLEVLENINDRSALKVINTSTGNKAIRSIEIGSGSNGSSVQLLSTDQTYTNFPNWSDAGVLTSQNELSRGLILRAAAGKIRFQGAPGEDLMAVDQNGNMGIGTVNPTAKLEVSENLNGRSALKVINTSTGSNALRSIEIGNGSNGSSVQLISSDQTYTNFPSWSDAGVLTTQGELANGLVLRAAAGKIRMQGATGEDMMVVDQNGNMGIGTDNPTAMLTVAGNVVSREVEVTIAAGTGPDYVFEEDYDLISLEETKAYIEANKHLPEVPTAKVMESEGVKVGDMSMILLRKIEEMTLHQIELMEQVKALQTEINELKK